MFVFLGKLGLYIHCNSQDHAGIGYLYFSKVVFRWIQIHNHECLYLVFILLTLSQLTAVTGFITEISAVIVTITDKCIRDADTVAALEHGFLTSAGWAVL